MPAVLGGCDFLYDIHNLVVWKSASGLVWAIFLTILRTSQQ